MSNSENCNWSSPEDADLTRDNTTAGGLSSFTIPKGELFISISEQFEQILKSNPLLKPNAPFTLN